MWKSHGEHGDRPPAKIQKDGSATIGADAGKDTRTSKWRGRKGSEAGTDADGRGASGNQESDIQSLLRGRVFA